ncbi:MAG: hypothetical protein HY735_03795 [Verrucomicrobia bacterium]|nr:hypothetical protein [Verrucomicrobiota bacterium]
MSELQRTRSLSRRRFLSAGARGAAALGAIGVGAALSSHVYQRAKSGARSTASNPFAYDLSHLPKTDPNLIHYEQVGGFQCPHEEPRRIACGLESLLFLAASNYVSALDPNGGILFEIALSAPPRALAASGDGLVYVSLRDHIEIFDRKGQRRAAWESPGARTWLSGLTVSDNEVFAADAGHRVVLRYDRAGKLLGRIGERNAERDIPGFIVPSPFFDLELARDGLLRITNPGRHRVEAYTPEGDFEFAWGRASSAIEGFCGCCNPIHLALLPDGRSITCEKGLPRVKVYAPDGTFESVVRGPESFPEYAKSSAKDDADGAFGGLDATVDANGRIYILDPVAGEVGIMVKKTIPPDKTA